jgi:hypothetical protein
MSGGGFTNEYDRPDAPPEFPEKWEDLPVAIRRFLGQEILLKQLNLQGSPSGIFQWLYRGTERAGGVMVPYNATAREIWPMVVSDAAAWAATRTK